MKRAVYRMKRVSPFDLNSKGWSKGFEVQPLKHLLRQYFMFQASRSDLLVRLAQSPSFQSVVSKFLYGVYTGGETFESSTRLINEMCTRNTRTILDESIEEVHDQEKLDKNLSNKLSLLEKLNDQCPEVIFMPIKCTSLIHPQALEALTSLLDKARFDSWDHVADIPQQLSLSDRKLYEEGYSRLYALCEHVRDKSARLSLLLDAEQSPRQLAVEFIHIQLATQFNKLPSLVTMSKSKRLQMEREEQVLFSPVVYTTVQSYLTRSHTALQKTLAHCTKHGLVLGVKLVRGAYLQYEIQHSKERNIECAVHVSKETTDHSYQQNSQLLLDHLANFYNQKGVCNSLHVIYATHDRQSIEYVVRRIQEHLYALEFFSDWRKAKSHRMLSDHIHFAQILGRSAMYSATAS
ncbi:hypothetical protein EON64_02200 [archaeon]|nr:MAG: hypothetical protein EON64_02200 [archaeon]